MHYTSMIKVEKDIATDVAVTFAELTTISPVYYLIQVMNYMDEVVQSITPTETSGSIERYNLFEITSTLPAGEYAYEAYQSSTINPTINDVVGDPVEYGLFIVTTTEDVEDNIYT